MATCKMTLSVDTSAFDKVCLLKCNALRCAHNTRNISGGEGLGRCGLKYVELDSYGQCKWLHGTGTVEAEEIEK